MTPDMSENDERDRTKVERRARVESQFTAAELEVLQRCRKESFWYRCVPLGVVLVGGTQMLVARGFLKPHPKYGALLKNMGAALAALVLGKMSYHRQCTEMLMALPNSPLADAMRGRGRHMVNATDVASEPVEEPHNVRSRSADYGVDSRVEQKGLDDNLRPTMDRPSRQTEVTEKRSVVTYDELRRRNRDSAEPTSNSTQPGQPPSQPKATPNVPATAVDDSGWKGKDDVGKKAVRRNKWGDPIED